MNSGKNLYKSSPTKKAKIKSKKVKKISSEENSEKDNENEINLLKKKKKREEKEENEQEKIEINQNMYNQYNFYPGLYVSPMQMQIQQINNQNTNYPELYQNIYYINNPYEFFANQGEIETYPNEQEKIKDIKESINNMFKRGIVNNIIGAFFIEESKNCVNSVDKKENLVNNDNSDENDLSNVNSEVEKEKNDNNVNKEKNKNDQENDINGNNILKESRLKKPVLIW